MTRPAGAIDVLFHPPQGCCASPGAALQALDRCGIAAAFVSQCRQWTCERQWMCVESRLEDVLRFTRASARFVGLAGYNPMELAESMREMEAAAELGFRGVYFRCDSFGMRLGDGRVYPLLAKAAEVGLAVVLQIGIAEPDAAHIVERMAGEFSELPIAIAVAAVDERVAGLLEGRENVCLVLDATALAGLNRRQRHLLDSAAFVERCMWGSNGADPMAALDGVEVLHLAPPFLEELLRGTAFRFFAAPRQRRTPRALNRELAVQE